MAFQKKAYAYCKVSVKWLLCLAILANATGFAAISNTYLPQALYNGQYVTRWSDDTRTINITMFPAKNIPGWDRHHMKLVEKAFTQWQTAMNGRIRFMYTTDPTATDVMVQWHKTSKGMEIGHQSYRTDNHIFTDVDLVIALYDPQGRKFTDNEIYYIALHEIGHLLGIKGHSNDPNDIMYPEMQNHAPVLTSRDIGTMKALYQQKAAITNPPSVHLWAYRQYEYYSQLGISAFQSKDFKSAYEHFGKALQYHPKDIDTAFRTGVSAYNIKRWDDAVRNLKAAAQVPNSNQHNALFYWANALMASGASSLDKGDKNYGLVKLAEAKRQFTMVQQNPKCSPAQKKEAATRLALIAKISKEMQ